MGLHFIFSCKSISSNNWQEKNPNAFDHGLLGIIVDDKTNCCKICSNRKNKGKWIGTKIDADNLTINNHKTNRIVEKQSDR